MVDVEPVVSSCCIVVCKKKRSAHASEHNLLKAVRELTLHDSAGDRRQQTRVKMLRTKMKEKIFDIKCWKIIKSQVFKINVWL